MQRVRHQRYESRYSGDAGQQIENDSHQGNASGPRDDAEERYEGLHGAYAHRYGRHGEIAEFRGEALLAFSASAENWVKVWPARLGSAPGNNDGPLSARRPSALWWW